LLKDKPSLLYVIKTHLKGIPLMKTFEIEGTDLTRREVGKVISIKRNTDQERHGKGKKHFDIKTGLLQPGEAAFSNKDDAPIKTDSRETKGYAIARKPFEEIERRTVSDPVMFAGVNIFTNTIFDVVKPHMLMCDPRVRQAIIDNLWFKKPWKDCIKMGTRHLVTAGRTFVFPSMENSKVKEFVIGDPRIIDFIRSDQDSSVIRTSNGLFPYGFKYLDTVSFVDKKDDNLTEKEFIEGDMIYYLSINRWHYCDFGWGYAEILLDQIDQKLALSESRNTRTRREGLGVPVVTYGNDRQLPNPRMEAEALFVLDEILDANTVGLIKPNTIVVDNLDNLLSYAASGNTIDTEKYLNNLMASAMGIPLAVLMMSTDKAGGNRDIDALGDYFEFNVKAIADELRIDEMMTRWAEDNVEGDFNKDVKLHWGDVLPGSIKETSMRLFRMGKIGKIPNNEHVRRWIANVLGVDAETAVAIAKGISDGAMNEIGKQKIPAPQLPKNNKKGEEPNEPVPPPDANTKPDRR